MFKLWKNPCGPFPFCISVKKWDVCRISAVVGCPRCLQNNVLFTCAARLGILAQPMLPVLPPHPDPSGILQTGQVPPPPVVRGCRCLCAHISALPQQRAVGRIQFAYSPLPSRPSPLQRIPTANVPMPVPWDSQLSRTGAGGIANARVRSQNCIIQCCQLPLLRQCVLDIGCTEGQLVLGKQTGCFA